MNKNIIFITSNYNGGVGRVLSLLSDRLKSLGYNVSFVFTVKQHNKVIIDSPDFPVYVLENSDNIFDKKIARILFFISRIIGKINSDYGSIIKYYSRNYCKIKRFKNYLKLHKNSVVVAFLNEPVFFSLLCRKKCNKVIISERNDPAMFVSNKTTMSFINRLYPKSYRMVCQSQGAEDWYSSNTTVKTKVISNPVKNDLPIYAGKRNKTIVNFCRISSQKNLLCLAEAFNLLYKCHPDYSLLIIGNAAGPEAEEHLLSVKKLISEYHLEQAVSILPGRNDVHEYVKDCAMFVSSSDFEGMSNSMLEAMAMGMPVVCTDCPAGGARAVIQDGVNGLLTPVGDAEALAAAMNRIIENPEFAESLGAEAAKIRDQLSPDKIAAEWIKLIEE